MGDRTGQATAAPVTVRDVADVDMAAITDIYTDAVLNGVASWEMQPPDVAEMTRRRDGVRGAGYPYRIAERNGRVLGYAYASAYRTRPAYRWTVENSVYVDPSTRGLGVGRLLMADLIRICSDLGYRQMLAIVGGSDNPSVDFHRRIGFRECGRIDAIGYKFDAWLDSVVLQLPLGDGADSAPAEPRPYKR